MQQQPVMVSRTFLRESPILRAPAIVSTQWFLLCRTVLAAWEDRPEPVREDAVLLRLEQLARQATRGLPPTIQQHTTDDAASVLYLAFRHFDPERRFNPWARRVLWNHAVSLLRTHQREQDSQEQVEQAVSRKPHRCDDLAQLLVTFRHLCDRARFPQRAGSSLAAVFALESRRRLLDWLPSLGLDFLDEHYPLRPAERSLCVQPGWPTLETLWPCLAGFCARNVRSIDRIAIACGQLGCVVDGRLLKANWSPWIYRAREVVSRYAETPEEERLLEVLFPQNRR